MGLLQDGITFELSQHDSPLSKRRRFTPQTWPSVIPHSDNSGIQNQTFDSPLLLQLCDQAPLPEEIQADLLKVGMRVRKAVPEGYKTRRFTPRPFFNMGRLSPDTQAAITGSPKQDAVDLSPYYAGGLHNVGGLAMQPIATATFCGISLAALSDSDSWNSQSYSEQKMWSYSTSHKRSLQLDEDSDEYDWSPQTPALLGDAGYGMPVDYFNIDVENMGDVSPLTQIHRHKRDNSFPLKQTTLPELNMMGANGRRVAKPKSRLRAPAPEMAPASFNPFANLGMTPEQQRPTTSTVSHHTRMTSCGMEMGSLDFGESCFLQRREDVEMDCS